MEAPIIPAALSLTRFDMDSMLWQIAMKMGIDCRQQITVQSVAHNGEFLLHTSAGSFRASAVINASGRWSRLAAHSAPPLANGNPKWIGLKAHFFESAAQCSVDLYFFAGGYCGVQPVGNGCVNACAMVRAEVATDLQQVFRLHPVLQRRAREWQPAMEPVSTSPLIFQRPHPVQDCMFNAGDAAGFIDPFVGDGITLALRSGIMASETLAQFLSHRSELNSALNRYQHLYNQHLAPAFYRASRIRQMLSLPKMMRAPLVSALRLTHTTGFLVKHTRS